MNTPQDPFLQAAAQAIQTGALDKARAILAALLSQDEQNVDAWFLLSAAVEQPVTIAACLRRVLQLAPDHPGALLLRSQLEQQWQLPPLQVMQVATTSSAINQPCPFCTSPIQVMDAVVTCAQCHTSHHYSCWQENGYCCAVRLCHGFSLYEQNAQPLPTQPAPSDTPVLVIHKDDLGNVRRANRKEQEQGFQRHLLMLALLGERGHLPSQLAGALPSVDDLLDQIQRDRSSAKTSPPPSTPSQQSTQSVAPTGQMPAQPLPPASNYQKTGVVVGTMPIWASPANAAQPPAMASPAQCRQCGYPFPAVHPAFCPRCGCQVK